MSTPRTVVIIGGVAGGMSAATRLRRRDESARIVVFERGDHVSFANCGLPYVVGGVIEERDDVLLQTPEHLRERFELDVRIRHDVVAIDVQKQVVTVRDLGSGRELIQSYDELVLSPGARAVRPDLPGSERALTLRDVADLDRLLAAVDGASTAVIVGGGFIGLEMAENLHRRGLAVTIVEAGTQVMAPLDPEMSAFVEQELHRRGPTLKLESGVASIGANDVVLTDGERIPADVVVMSIGVLPDTALATQAGLETGLRGAIAVDEHQRTSAPHVYAVGDAVAKRSVDGADVLIPLANTANRQGRLVADVIAGDKQRPRTTRGTAILGMFDLVVATTGESERQVRNRGVQPRIIHTHPMDHAGYYPGAEQLALKVVIDPSTDGILGAQAVGGAGVDKRIDVIATAMAGGLRASDLADLELAYAPQFGSAKDPINMVGFIAMNLRDGLADSIQWHELAQAVEAGACVVDVRSALEHEESSIPGAFNIPLDQLRDRLEELPGTDLVVHCAVGQRGHTAARILRQRGQRVRNLDGGWRTWAAGIGQLVDSPPVATPLTKEFAWS